MSTNAYDGRNRLASTQRRVAVPGGSDEIATRYTPNIYAKNVEAYSEANRPLTTSTGADAPDLLVNGDLTVSIGYLTNSWLNSVSTSYGSNLVQWQTYSASGHATRATYADAASTVATMAYDGNGALLSYGVQRSAGPWISSYAVGGPPGSGDYTTAGQLLNESIQYDMVGNPIMMGNNVPTGGGGGSCSCECPANYVCQCNGDVYECLPPGSGNPWPSGAMPWTSRTLSYWDDYRLSSAGYAYGATGTDVVGVDGDPYTDGELTTATYAPLAKPSTGNRALSQTYGYDYRGNVISAVDDAQDYWDRSLGAVSYTSGNDQLATSTGASAMYDASGNITTLTTATGETLEFSFDEMGRLAMAVREDAAGTIVTEKYAYDAKGERVLIDNTPAHTQPDVYTVQVFDSLVLKNATYPDANGDYEHGDATEQVYFNAGGQTLGHAFYDTTGSLPSSTSSGVHTYIPFTDPLKSTSFVVDQSTSEVVEAQSYLAYGQVDMDFRPTRWNALREDQRYTGQWDNAEVGLVYMHARYYSPQLGRFISPDPKTILGRGPENPYEYSAGSPFRFLDPTGLAPSDDPWWGTSNPDFLSYYPGQTQSQADQANENAQWNAAAHEGNVSNVGRAYDLPEETVTSTWDESGNLFGFSSGNANLSWIRTPSELQMEQLSAFTTIGSIGIAAFVAPEAVLPNAKGPPATLNLAQEVNALAGEYSYNQTIALTETNGGPTYMAAKGMPLSPEQVQWAQANGYTIAGANPTWHAEWQTFGAAVSNGQQATFGVSSNLVCSTCGRWISGANGWVDAFTFGFPFESPSEGP